MTVSPQDIAPSAASPPLPYPPPPSPQQHKQQTVQASAGQSWLVRCGLMSIGEEAGGF